MYDVRFRVQEKLDLNILLQFLVSTLQDSQQLLVRYRYFYELAWRLNSLYKHKLVVVHLVYHFVGGDVLIGERSAKLD